MDYNCVQSKPWVEVPLASRSVTDRQVLLPATPKVSKVSWAMPCRNGDRRANSVTSRRAVQTVLAYLYILFPGSLPVRH